MATKEFVRATQCSTAVDYFLAEVARRGAVKKGRMGKFYKKIALDPNWPPDIETENPILTLKHWANDNGYTLEEMGTLVGVFKGLTSWWGRVKIQMEALLESGQIPVPTKKKKPRRKNPGKQIKTRHLGLH